MADKIHFGPGCSTIEVDPFEPICGYPEPQKSSASTFEVPLPAFVPPVPPSECVCFDFTSDEVAVTTVRCGQPTKCRVEIKPVGDCCDGVYKVTPHIEVPCIPFDIAPAVVTTTVKQGTTPKASFRLEKDCFGCQLKPYLDIEFPLPQIVVPTPCFKVQGDNAYPPTTSAASKVGKAVRALVSAVTKGRKAVRTLAATPQNPFRVRAKYKDDSGTDKYAYGTFTVSEDSSSGCDVFTIGSADLDLTGIGGGFSNGGDVNALTISGKKVLAIDGGLYDDVPIYGGGFGNLTYDDPDKMYCRGNIMRNSSHPSGYDNTSVPVTSINQQRLVRLDKTYETAWKASTRDDTGAYKAGTGALDMYIPSAVQWHAPASGKPIRGVALVFSEFVFNSAGTLAEEYEGTGAAIIAPGIAVDNTGANKSGLQVTADGLGVFAGKGVKIDNATGTSYGSLTLSLGNGVTFDTSGNVTLSVGAGLSLTSAGLSATLRSVAGVSPTSGNVPTASLVTALGGSDSSSLAFGDHTHDTTDINGFTSAVEGVVDTYLTDEYVKTDRFVKTDGKFTDDLLVHKHSYFDVIVGATGDTTLSTFFTADKKLNLSTALEQGTDGDIHVVGNKLTVRVGSVADKWVKTTTNGALTVAIDEPIALDHESTGFVYNNAGTPEYIIAGDGLSVTSESTGSYLDLDVLDNDLKFTAASAGNPKRLAIDDANNRFAGSFISFGTGGPTLLSSASRTTEYVLPVLVPTTSTMVDQFVSRLETRDCYTYSAGAALSGYIPNVHKILDEEESVETQLKWLRNWLGTLRLEFIHVGKAGTVLGVDSLSGVASNAPWSGARNVTS